MNEPWSCPSPGCPYKGLEAVHVLSIMSRCPPGHISSSELSRLAFEARERRRLERERDTIVCQAEIPVDLFSGLAVSDIFDKVMNLASLLTYSERLVVQDSAGNQVTSSPAALKPHCPTALLTVRWPKVALDLNPESFWALVRRRYDAVLMANEVKLDFPGGREVVLKDRHRLASPNDFVPVPV